MGGVRSRISRCPLYEETFLFFWGTLPSMNSFKNPIPNFLSSKISHRTTDLLAHCLCWWVFWLGLLAVFWLRKDPKTLVILWFLFVYSPIKLSKRRIKFDQHFPITLHQAVHNARVSPSSLVASTTTLRLQ